MANLWGPVPDRWFVEVVIDTGQRYQSMDLDQRTAEREAADMRGRCRVISVTMIEATTGCCITKPSRNLMAGVSWVEANATMERQVLAEALGA